jgi:hypothetical protein
LHAATSVYSYNIGALQAVSKHDGSAAGQDIVLYLLSQQAATLCIFQLMSEFTSACAHHQTHRELL